VQQAYVAGLNRHPFAVLGKPLAPLTLGHLRLLYAAESPYVCGMAGDSCTIGDLAFAAFVCSFSTWEDAHAALHSKGVESATMKWGEKCPPPMCQTSADTFLEYLSYYMSAPAMSSESNAQTRPEYVPLPYMAAAILRHYFGMSDDEAWHTIVADALAWNAARLQMEGHKCLLSDFDAYLIAHAAELEAQQEEAANA